MLSQVAFPKELQNEIDFQLPASVNSYNVKVVPSNGSQFQTATQTLTASSTLNLNGSNQNIIFDVPCGQGKSVFVDPRFSTLNFRVNYEIVNTPSAAVITNMQLRSSAMAHFDRTYTQSQSGVLLDDVNLCGLVQDALIALEVDVAQRDALALMYGFQYESAASNSQNLNQGHIISGINGSTLAAAASKYYSYSMPLLNSLIGKGGKKFFQVGATNKLQVVLQTAAVLPLSIVTGTVTTAATFRVTIDNIFLSLQYVDIGQDGLKMLNKTGLQYYDGVTYRVSSGTLSAGTTGAVSILSGIRGSSVKALWTRFCSAATTTTAGCINYIYDSKMPVANSISYNVNGVLNPSNPIDLVRAPATAFSLLQESNSSFNNYEFKSGLVPANYLVYVESGSSLPTDADTNISSSTSAVTQQSQFHFGVNMEKISKYGILDGQNLNSGNTFLNMTTSIANTNTLTIFFIAKMDIVYILDTATGEVSVRL
jgi:hypothetical protein